MRRPRRTRPKFSRISARTATNNIAPNAAERLTVESLSPPIMYRVMSFTKTFQRRYPFAPTRAQCNNKNNNTVYRLYGIIWMGIIELEAATTEYIRPYCYTKPLSRFPLRCTAIPYHCSLNSKSSNESSSYKLVSLSLYIYICIVYTCI